MEQVGISGRIARAFIKSKLTPLMVLASLLLGIFAVAITPREEEPQIVVPMIDVMVAYPGASAQEVEDRVTRPMEKFLWEIKGVEYIYSIVKPGMNLTIVRFYVGENMEDSIVNLYNKLMANFDKIPPGVTQPLVKPKSIDDVPILSLTFHSEKLDPLELRGAVARLRQELNAIPDVSETTILGGRKRQFQVFFDEEKLKERRIRRWSTPLFRETRSTASPSRATPLLSLRRMRREWLTGTRLSKKISRSSRHRRRTTLFLLFSPACKAGLFKKRMPISDALRLSLHGIAASE